MYAKKEPSFICPARALGCMAVDVIFCCDVSDMAASFCKPPKSCNGRMQQRFG